MGAHLLPFAPDSIRQLRELVRYRHELSQVRTGLKGQSHSVMGKEAIIPILVELWRPAGAAYLDSLDMADACAKGVDSLRAVSSHVSASTSPRRVLAYGCPRSGSPTGPIHVGHHHLKGISPAGIRLTRA